jgi:hypothetical protein
MLRKNIASAPGVESDRADKEKGRRQADAPFRPMKTD